MPRTQALNACAAPSAWPWITSLQRPMQCSTAWAVAHSRRGLRMPAESACPVNLTCAAACMVLEHHHPGLPSGACCLQQGTKAHTKGRAAWAKHVHKIASLLAFHQPHGLDDPNDISGAESLLENYFMLVCLHPSFLVIQVSHPVFQHPHKRREGPNHISKAEQLA